MKKPSEITKEQILKLDRAMLTEDGKEILNPKPKLALVGAAKPESLLEKMRKMKKIDQTMEAMEKHHETWEEHNDFHMDDDVDEEFFNTNFTLIEDEIPKSYKAPSKEAMEVASQLIAKARKIEAGEIDPLKEDPVPEKPDPEVVKDPEGDGS